MNNDILHCFAHATVFIELITEGYLLLGAMSKLQINTFTDTPLVLPQDPKDLLQYATSLAEEVVDLFFSYKLNNYHRRQQLRSPGVARKH